MRINAGTNRGIGYTDVMLPDGDNLRPIAIKRGDGFRLCKTRTGGLVTSRVWVYVGIEPDGRGGSVLRLRAVRPRRLRAFLALALLAGALVSVPWTMASAAPVALAPAGTAAALAILIFPTMRLMARREQRVLVQQLARIVRAQAAPAPDYQAPPRISIPGPGHPPAAPVPAPPVPVAAEAAAPPSATLRASVPRPRAGDDPVVETALVPLTVEVSQDPKRPPVTFMDSDPGGAPEHRANAVVRHILELIPGGLDIGPIGGLAEVTFEVTRADGVKYTTSCRISFSSVDHRKRLTVGTKLPVRVDPSDHSRIVLD